MDVLEAARRFARSLDAEDYGSVGECVAAAARYEIHEQVHEGREGILASYRASGEWAARTLDRVRYSSSVRRGERGEVIVEFIDDLEHGGATLRHRCEQRLHFEESGLISRIVHVDLPGEQAALSEFFKAVGLSRREPGEGPANSPLQLTSGTGAPSESGQS